ncbi:MAG: hypothetical protein GY809_16405 [Planctomycetes bacterium]|nr:hypothetical protein [Planctomycetota bacterium]
MKTRHYDLWIQHHQTIAGPIDVTDAVMASVTQPEPTVYAQIRKACVPALRKPNDWFKGSMLAFGAVTGLLRMMFFVYYALFI